LDRYGCNVPWINAEAVPRYILFQSSCWNILQNIVPFENLCHVLRFKWALLPSYFGDKLPALFTLTSPSLSGTGKIRQHAIAHMVTHPDTNHAQRCLTSVILKERAYSTCYRRWLFYSVYLNP
jgi:hypothetical protein